MGNSIARGNVGLEPPFWYKFHIKCIVSIRILDEKALQNGPVDVYPRARNLAEQAFPEWGGGDTNGNPGARSAPAKKWIGISCLC